MKNKALFLDRDGVINIDRQYVYQIEKFEFVPGIFDLCQTAQQLGYKLIIITNQSGIDLGYYTVQDFEQVSAYMLGEFEKRQIHIDELYWCQFMQSIDHKPYPGLFIKAKYKYDLDMKASFSIGDKETDISAGVNAGVGTNILFGMPSKHGTQADKVVSDLSEVRQMISSTTC